MDRYGAGLKVKTKLELVIEVQRGCSAIWGNERVAPHTYFTYYSHIEIFRMLNAACTKNCMLTDLTSL